MSSTQSLGSDRILSVCGSPLTSQAVGPKLLWLRKANGELFAPAHRLLMPSSMAVLRLTGEYVLDHHSASQCDPLYDLQAGRWIEEWWHQIAGELPRPRLLWPAEIAGEVTSSASAVTGIPPGTPVCAGTIDAWAESVAAGAKRPGDLMVMYGSTMFLVKGTSSPVTSPSLWATAGVDPGTFSLAAGMATGGLAVTWLRALVGEPAWEEFLEPAAAVPAGSRGLLFLPYLAGERTPIFDPAARGLMLGLSLRHGQPELLRAVFEGIAYAIRHNVDAMASAGAPSGRIIGTGGGTRSGVLPQIITDVLGAEQALCDPALGASFGSAILAARATSPADAPDDWVRIQTVLEPAPAHADVYSGLYERYLELYPRTAADMHALTELETTSRASAAP